MRSGVLGSARFQRASLRILRKELETLGARSRDLSPCYLDVGYWILDVETFRVLGSARFQRASLRILRKEPDPRSAAARPLPV